MHKDLGRWIAIRRKVREGDCSIRGAAREFGVSRNTVRKILVHPTPLAYPHRARSSPKLGPHMGAIRTMLEADTVCSSPTTRDRGSQSPHGIVDRRGWLVPALLQASVGASRLPSGRGLVARPGPAEDQRHIETRREGGASKGRPRVDNVDLHVTGPAVSSLCDLDALIARMKRGSPRDRTSTMAVIARAKGISAREAGALLGICARTVRKRCAAHAAGGPQGGRRGVEGRDLRLPP